ncbi:MAG TPA: hypothetical protein VG722_03260, partial [Tepidisphaeraceae bacterium]|nr:hypothetical protein [Tepidisphaeraceae bacterium]
MRQIAFGVLAGTLLCITGGVLCGQTAPEPLSILNGRPDQANNEPLTGEVFSDRLQGISLRPPAKSEVVRQGLVAGDIAEFINKDLGWSLKVSRAELKEPMPLATTPAKQGLLDLTAEQFKTNNSSAKIIQQKIEKIGQYDCGLLSADYSQSGQKRLMQQTIFHFNDEIYYVLTMSSPAGNPMAEERASRTFEAVAHSVELFDRSKIKQDQDQRLLRTRTFYEKLTPAKIRQVLVPEQYERITQNGKDIGYRYIVEEPEKRYGRSGIRIGIRAHLGTDGKTKVDSQAWLTCSFDRRQEEWSSEATTTDAKGQSASMSELGTSTQYVRQFFDPVHGTT